MQLVPDSKSMPKSGGVMEHIRQLLKHLPIHDVEIIHSGYADITHVQTAYRNPNRKLDVWTCHGGFVPLIPMITENMTSANKIISVAAWLLDRHFPRKYWDKTIIIPNGVDLAEWESLPPSGIERGFILWGKGFYRQDWLNFYNLAQNFPKEHFVSTLAPDGMPKLSNLSIIGLQSHEKMRRIINDCAVYVSTGSEVCPTMILEAWACSKPVLAWNGDGNCELLRNGGGVLYSDTRAMEAGLQECLEGAKEIGATGRRLAEERYNWLKIAERTVEVYRRCF